MATREENLKKINAELEKLSDDELDKVAGGQIIRMSAHDIEDKINHINILHVRASADNLADSAKNYLNRMP